jgi:hypothetical protein
MSEERQLYCGSMRRTFFKGPAVVGVRGCEWCGADIENRVVKV